MPFTDVHAVVALLREVERRMFGARPEGLAAAGLRERAEHIALVAAARVPPGTAPAVRFEPVRRRPDG
jgi:hypothetical protein